MESPASARRITSHISTTSIIEACIRICLFLVFHYLESVQPFIRIIRDEEAWLYKFPNKGSFPPKTAYESYFSNFISFVFHPYALMVSGVAVILIVYGIDRRVASAEAATKTLTLALPLTGVITNIVKTTVGRPRPDFFSRCYGKDFMRHKNALQPCIYGYEDFKTMDGRRSFPSGHSAMSFCIMGFISLYINSLLQPYANSDAPKSWKYLLLIFPLMIASLVAISRTCDYKHHYEDVIAGSLLGLTITYSIFKLYFPSGPSTPSDKY